MAERRSPICDAASQHLPGAYLYCPQCWRTFSTTTSPETTRCSACADRPLILAVPPVRPCAQCGAVFNHYRSGRCPRCGAVPVQRAPPRERSRSRSAPPRAAGAEAGTGGDRRPSWSSPREGAALGGTGSGPPARVRGRVEAALVVGRPLLYTLPRTGSVMVRNTITPHPGGDSRVGEVWFSVEAWLPPGTHLVVRATIESNATAAQGG